MRLRSLSTALALATAAGSFVAAAPSAHKHRHVHRERVEKRAPNSSINNVPGPTAVAYEYDGQPLSDAQVCQGIADGSLQWPEGSTPSIDCSATEAASATLAAPATSAVSILPSSVGVTPDNEGKPPTATSTASGSLSSGTGLDQDFPDGLIDCSNFPSDYGPISIEWAQLGGWSGIQYVTVSGNSVSNIITASPGDTCKPGAMCSYACPAGYQKSQWPAAQGATGQSVGGLQCTSNGKLALTNPQLSKNLCIPGTGAVLVQNKLVENAAICRTDYPGTEAEVVPLNTQPDSTNNLTCPDAQSYYTHEGAPTTAQYYINNQGGVVSSACTWGTDGSGMGNWAPSYLGVGQDGSGKTWLSISSTIQNNPSSYKALNYSVEITGNTSGKCRLSGGQYCSGADYNDCNENGCTVSLWLYMSRILTDFTCRSSLCLDRRPMCYRTKLIIPTAALSQ